MWRNTITNNQIAILIENVSDTLSTTAFNNLQCRHKTHNELYSIIYTINSILFDQLFVDTEW